VGINSKGKQLRGIDPDQMALDKLIVVLFVFLSQTTGRRNASYASDGYL